MAAQPLAVHTTDIPGLLIVDLPVHGDNRGWFKENWQRAKMTELGLPDFGPVQQNISFNDEVGVTRGIHAEPWDKFVSVATGRIFGAWVDLREGDAYGTVVTVEMGPDTAVFVPRGVGNSYQTLEPNTAYAYLVNDHWSAEAKERYSFVQLADPELGIAWPIPLSDAVLSDADKAHPNLAQARPVTSRRPLILGAGGQLGLALQEAMPDALALPRAEADLARPETLEGIDWRDVSAIVNAAAYTAVDTAETPEGRKEAWATNVTGVAHLTRLAREHGIPLVHVSSDYVFDGTVEEHHEDEAFSPLGVYGQTKAAGDSVVAVLDGLRVFTQDIAAGIRHLLDTHAPYGTYNLTNGGPVQTWADIAADVFELCGRNRADVGRVSTEEYGAGKDMAPRPRHSALSTSKIEKAGFAPAPAAERLRQMLSR